MSKELQKDEYFLPGNLGSVLIGGQRRSIIEAFIKKDGSTTITIGGYEIPVIIDEEMPPNQFKLVQPKQITTP